MVIYLSIDISIDLSKLFFYTTILLYSIANIKTDRQTDGGLCVIKFIDEPVIETLLVCHISGLVKTCLTV